MKNTTEMDFANPDITIVMCQMIGTILDKENSVRQVKRTRKRLSKEKFDLDEINN